MAIGFPTEPPSAKRSGNGALSLTSTPRQFVNSLFGRDPERAGGSDASEPEPDQLAENGMPVVFKVREWGERGGGAKGDRMRCPPPPPPRLPLPNSNRSLVS